MRHPLLQRLQAAGTVAVAAVAFAGFAALSSSHLGMLRARALEERRAKISLAVELAHELIAQHQRREARGEISRETAQRSALDALRALRFERDDFFWVHTFGDRILMHPIRTDLEGRALGAYTDPQGRRIFAEFDQLVRSSATHAGFVSYLGPRPNHADLVAKLSYVKLFEPWGWVVGTGIYMDDVQAALALERRQERLELALVALFLAAAAAGAIWAQGRARRLEREIQQASRLESVAQLAAGLAHEINTPLQFLRDNAEFQGDALAAMVGLWERQHQLVTALEPEVGASFLETATEADLPYLLERIPESFAGTLMGIGRIATLVSAMGGFAHCDRSARLAVDLNRALGELVEVVRGKYGDFADVVPLLGELPPVVCHAGQIELAFLSLMVNAAEAIAGVARGSGTRGRLELRSRQLRAQVVVTLSDTGGGIPEPIRHRVFDPFFTTKAIGQGSGQGLALARSIVEAHDGTIAFETFAGKGTTFTVRLPIGERGAGVALPDR